MARNPVFIGEISPHGRALTVAILQDLCPTSLRLRQREVRGHLSASRPTEPSTRTGASCTCPARCGSTSHTWTQSTWNVTKELTVSLYLVLVHLHLNVYMWLVVVSRDIGELRCARDLPNITCGFCRPGDSCLLSPSVIRWFSFCSLVPRDRAGLPHSLKCTPHPSALHPRPTLHPLSLTHTLQSVPDPHSALCP